MGKTSLLMMIAAVNQPTCGRLYYHNQPYSSQVIQTLHQNLCWLPQSPQSLGETVKEAIYAPFNLVINKQNTPTDEQCLSALADLSLDNISLTQRFDSLSGGEQQRLAIARGLLLNRPLWLVDEPTSAQDKTRSDLIVDLLLARTETLIIITHDQDIAEQFPIVWQLGVNGISVMEKRSTEVEKHIGVKV
ncbi:ATP-binding cassette domain-containing protein [Vibrio sp. SS-MA-C1-2]|nr:ATP-binding cassette domain-containing protein [Vibrio sp. SS-MA-C1-2]